MKQNANQLWNWGEKNKGMYSNLKIVTCPRGVYNTIEKTGSAKKSDNIGSPPIAQHKINQISDTDSKCGRLQREGDDYVLTCFNFILN